MTREVNDCNSDDDEGVVVPDGRLAERRLTERHLDSGSVCLAGSEHKKRARAHRLQFSLDLLHILHSPALQALWIY